MADEHVASARRERGDPGQGAHTWQTSANSKVSRTVRVATWSSCCGTSAAARGSTNSSWWRPFQVTSPVIRRKLLSSRRPAITFMKVDLPLPGGPCSSVSLLCVPPALCVSVPCEPVPITAGANQCLSVPSEPVNIVAVRRSAYRCRAKRCLPLPCKAVPSVAVYFQTRKTNVGQCLSQGRKRGGESLETSPTSVKVPPKRRAMICHCGMSLCSWSKRARQPLTTAPLSDEALITSSARTYRLTSPTSAK